MKIIGKIKCMIGLHDWRHVIGADFAAATTTYAVARRCHRCGVTKVKDVYRW